MSSEGTVKKLGLLIDRELDEIKTMFLADPEPDLFAIEICRAIDLFSILPPPEGQESLWQYMKGGYPTLVKYFYECAYFRKGFPLVASQELNIFRLVDTTLIHAGQLALAKQIKDQAVANLVSLEEINPAEFQLFYNYEKTGLEYLENKSLSHHFTAVYKSVIEPQEKKHLINEKRILAGMRELVQISHQHFIKYGGTPEIDDYYTKLGYFQLISNQLHDIFDESKSFGGIAYKKYLGVLQALIGTNLKHVGFCNCLLEKNPTLNPRNLVNVPFLIEDLVPQYADYLNLRQDEVRQIFDCFTVTPENIDFHINDSFSFSPAFVKISHTHVLKSIYGTSNKPIMFLNKELKRRYPADYHNNTDREEGFRNELYSLFELNNSVKKRLLTSKKGIVIKSGSIHTDIDAVIFDPKTKSLGLFQLKWQELFGHNLNERRNRLSNLAGKADDWVGKISDWASTNDSKDILSALQFLDRIVDQKSEIKQVYLFVISRFNMHFTGHTPDDRAAWGSWYQVQELYSKTVYHHLNPLRELFYKLKEDSPLNKSIGDEMTDFELKCSSFKIHFKKSAVL